MKRTALLSMPFAALLVLCAATAASAMYHPTLGRFVQRDPDGSRDGMTLYQYARSNPALHVDHTGAAAQSTARSPRIIPTPPPLEWGFEVKGSDDPWNQAAQGTLKDCPQQLTLPVAVEEKVSYSLLRTLATGDEFGGVITFERGLFTAWGPVQGTPKNVDVKRSAPTDKTRGEYFGYYHTHPPRKVFGDTPQRETSFSQGDIEGWWSESTFAIVRSCSCTLALLKTGGWRASTEKSREALSNAIGLFDEDDMTRALHISAYEPTIQSRRDKLDELVRQKGEVLGAAAIKAGVCYYRKCGPGPNQGQQTLDLVGRK